MKFNPADLIIDRPDLISPGQKVTAWGITFLFWGALLYLWQPLLSIIAWGLNIRLFYNHMILLGGYSTFLRLLVGYLQVIVLLGGGLILWARINQWRFADNERRRSPGDTDLLQLREIFGVEAAELTAAADAQIVKVSFAANGQIETITTSPGGAIQADNTQVYPQNIPTNDQEKLANQPTNF